MRSRRGAVRRGFFVQDVGTAGWTIPTPSALDTGTYPRTDKAQPGSRIYYIDPTNGVDPVGAYGPSANADVYFWNGSSIVDSTGSPTGAGGVAYGTDPLEPTGPIKPFKSWAYVAPRAGTTSDIGTASSILAPAAAASIFREGFPDWWCFKGGETLDFYKDQRAFLDANGLSTSAISSTNVLRTAGGRSSTERSVLATYGPVSAGRARFKHFIYACNGYTGNAGMRHQLMTGLMFDGSDRDMPLRPVDWSIMTDPDAGLQPLFYLKLGDSNPDLVFEDNLFYQCKGTNIQWLDATTPQQQVILRRNIFADGWDDGSNRRVVARKATGDPDQTWAADGAAHQVTWPTEDTDGDAAFSGGVYTVPAGFTGASCATSWYGKVWYLMDLTGTIAADGSVKVSLYVSGSEVSSKVVAGTGVAGDTYQLAGVLYTDRAAFLATGATIDLRVSTVNGSGTITLLGNQKAKLTLYKLNVSGTQGLYMQPRGVGAQFTLEENILIRNGFNVPPNGEPGMFPDRTTRQYNFNILNHNIYLVGDCDGANCNVTNNVSIIGAAGDVVRCPAHITKNLIYGGYFSIALEHETRPYTAVNGSFCDNVLLRYQPTTAANVGSHTGSGVALSSGAVDWPIKRNIISDVHLDGITPLFNVTGVVLKSTDTPYFKPFQLEWQNDITGVAVEDNQIDQTTSTNNYAFREYNGESERFLQWNTPITGMTKSSTAGTVLTCTPTSGYTGTPTYQWYRYRGESNTTCDLITGATSSTFTLAKSTATFTIGSPDIQLPGHGFIAGQWVMPETDGTLPTGLSPNTNYIVLATGLTTDTFRLSTVSGVAVTPSGTQSGTHTFTQDYGYSLAWGGLYHRLACVVGGITYPVGTGLSGCTFANNTVTKSAGVALSNYTAQTLLAGVVPATSNTTISGNSEYASRAAAGSALGWTNPDACIATALRALGVSVTTADGALEYYETVIGLNSTSANPMLTAMRRRKWDKRLTGIEMGNHVRSNRAMAVV